MENTIGIENVRLVKKTESKVKAYFDVTVESVNFGDITIRNFKAVNGKDGLFISMPNRAFTVPGGRVVNEAGETIRTEEDKVSYYNDIKFSSTEHFNAFKDALSAIAIPAVQERLTVSQ